MTRGHLIARVAEAGAVIAVLCIGAALVGRLAAAPPAEVRVAGYATSLAGRTPGQRHNARLAAEALDGCVIAAGGEFSFNRRVGSWSADRGYVKAPVSFEGELVPAYGGGVCQTSTTLYNAAMLAGLDIVERHPHVHVARYAPPGRDAAVAQPNVDLRLRNPHTFPVRIYAAVHDDRVETRLLAPRRLPEGVRVVTRVLSVTMPARLTLIGGAARRGDRAMPRNPGAPGFRVVTYRVHYRRGVETRRVRVSDDTYAPMDRVIAFPDEAG